jgi:arylsulfatase A-like enzyme
MAKRTTRGAAPRKSGNTSGKPNILVIWGDDIGQSNLSCYTHGLMGYRYTQHRPHRRGRNAVHRFVR